MPANPSDSAILTGILQDLLKKINENQTFYNISAAVKKLTSGQTQNEFYRYSATIRLLALMDELKANDLQNKESEEELIRPSHTALKNWLMKNKNPLSDFKTLRGENPNQPHIQWNDDQSATFDKEYEMAIILALICSAKNNTINIAVTLPQCPKRGDEAKDDSKRILDLHKYVSKIYETTLKKWLSP